MRGSRGEKGRWGRVRAVAALAAVVLLSGTLAAQALKTGRARWQADKGWEQVRAGGLPAAIGRFNRALGLRPGLHTALRGLGEAYFSLFQRQPNPVLLEKAEANYREAVNRVPADLDSLMRLWHVRALRAGGEPEPLTEAVSAAAALAARRPGDPDLQRAFLTLVRDVLRNEPLAARVFSDQGVRLRVVESANSLLAGRPDSLKEIDFLLDPALLGPGAVTLAVAGSRSAQRALVERLLDRGLWETWGGEILEAAETTGDAGVFPLAASALNARGRKREAAAVLRAHLERSPTDAASHFALAAMSGGGSGPEWELAREHYMRAVALQPNSGGYRARYGAELLKRGAHREAVEQLEAARRLQGGNAPLSFMLGGAYEHLGEFEAARKSYRRAVTLAPENDRYREALDRVLRKG